MAVTPEKGVPTVPLQEIVTTGRTSRCPTGDHPGQRRRFARSGGNLPRVHGCARVLTIAAIGLAGAPPSLAAAWNDRVLDGSHIVAGRAAVNAQGDLVVPWFRWEGHRVMVADRRPDGSLRIQDVGETVSAEHMNSVEAAVTDDGTATVAWTDDQGVKVVRRPPAGDWSPVVNLAPPECEWCSPHLVAAGRDTVLVWNQLGGHPLHSAIWGPRAPTPILQTVQGEAGEVIDLTGGADGTAAITWAETPGSGPARAWLSVRRPGGPFGPPEVHGAWAGPQAITPTGDIVAGWSTYNEPAHYGVRHPDGSWTEAGDGQHGRLALDGAGEAVGVYTQNWSDSQNDIHDDLLSVLIPRGRPARQGPDLARDAGAVVLDIGTGIRGEVAALVADGGQRPRDTSRMTAYWRAPGAAAWSPPDIVSPSGLGMVQGRFASGPTGAEVVVAEAEPGSDPIPGMHLFTRDLPPPPPIPLPDPAPPLAVTVKGPATQRAAHAGLLKLAARCSRACALTLSARAAGVAAGTKHLRLRASERSQRTALRLNRRARTALLHRARRHHSTWVAVTATARTGDGATSVSRRRVRVSG